jgi:5'-nucleotidase/UDP-sugar diphosphatase
LLHILHVNDTETQPGVGWPQLATLIRQQRVQGRCDLLLHAGDICLGDRFGAERVRILNALAFDAIAIGNHDLDFGADALTSHLQDCTATALCANVTGFPYVKPYIFASAGSASIAICGVTLADMNLFQPERNTPGMRFLDPVETLRRLVPDLRRQATYVIVISHCGLEADLALASAVDGIDLIVGGHSHNTLTTPHQVGRTWVVQAGSGASYLGWVHVDPGGGPLSVSGGLLSTEGVPPDPEILAIARDAAEARADDEVAGYTDCDLRFADGAQETLLGNWTADALRTYAATNVALIRCSSVANTFHAGPILRSQVGGLNSVSMDRVARLTLSGSELLAVLECGAREAYYLLTASGARVVYDAARPIGERVRSATVSGAPIDPRCTYTVACSEILARGAAGFTPLVGKPYELLPHTIAEVLAAQLAAERCIRPRLDGRLVVQGALPRRPVHPF